MQFVNRLDLHAELGQVEPLRHTPAGIPVVQIQLRHRSEVQEAGLPRRLSFDLNAVCMGALAEQVAEMAPGQMLQVSGFLAPQWQGSDRFVLHIQQVASSL